MKSPDFQTKRVVRMEENIVGFDVEVADSRLVQILQGFSKLATICNRKYTYTIRMKQGRVLENYSLVRKLLVQ